MIMSELIKELRDFAASPFSESYGDMQEAMAKAADLLESLQQSQWVSVEDRLPETEVPVLCWHPFWSMQLGWLDANNHLLIGLTGDAATHWMPLPTPPAKEQGS
jgi:hypothetical protein